MADIHSRQLIKRHQYKSITLTCIQSWRRYRNFTAVQSQERQILKFSLGRDPRRLHQKLSPAHPDATASLSRQDCVGENREWETEDYMRPSPAAKRDNFSVENVRFFVYSPALIFGRCRIWYTAFSDSHSLVTSVDAIVDGTTHSRHSFALSFVHPNACSFDHTMLEFSSLFLLRPKENAEAIARSVSVTRLHIRERKRERQREREREREREKRSLVFYIILFYIILYIILDIYIYIFRIANFENIYIYMF